VEEMKKVSAAVLEESGTEVLQYSTTEGHLPLRKKIAARMNKVYQTKVDSDNILITCGSQQILDFAGKLFLDEGDIVLCESPTYLAAISAFRPYAPEFIAVPTDDEGMVIDALEKILAHNNNVKLIYVIPDFQNPTGKTWSLTRRQQFMMVINQYEIPVIEDNPYGELRFEGEMLPSLKSMDNKELVMFSSTFSKTFCPGMRIGWLAASKQIREKFVLIKQGADLHTSTISQWEIAKYLDLYDFDANIRRIREVYRKRRDAMLDAMEREFPGNVRFTRPQGGLFTWVELPPHIKAVELLTECLKENVAFVPGDSFFPGGGVTNTFRLNYSNMPEERIKEGIRRIAKVIKQYA
jgi:2-aminoadipate transaminase